MEDNTIKAVFAMTCITALMSIALTVGINGALLAAVVGALSGLGGFAIGKKTSR